jgi:hypothetical protein
MMSVRSVSAEKAVEITFASADASDESWTDVDGNRFATNEVSSQE